MPASVTGRAKGLVMDYPDNVSANEALTIAAAFANERLLTDENERLRAVNAELVDALKNLVEIDKRDNKGDPDYLATDRWRHEAWRNAYTALANAEPVQ